MVEKICGKGEFLAWSFEPAYCLLSRSMNPNIYVGRCEGSAIYLKWYYEAIVDHVETVSHMPPLIRIGWANTDGFVPFPGAGSNWGANGVGDDLFSYGFDGVNLWTGRFAALINISQCCQK